MDSLINRKDRSLRNFYDNYILPLSFFGLGNADTLLNMKMYELEQLKKCMEDKDNRKFYYQTRGIDIE